MSRDVIFSGPPSGLHWSRSWSDHLDGMIRRIYDSILALHPQLSSVALVATGGYGRRELSPFSDLDIAVVPTDEQWVGLDDAIRALFKALHANLADNMGLKVDYGYRTISDAAGFDPTTRTGLLEMRRISGSNEALDNLQAALWDSFPTGDFLIAKIEERHARVCKTHSTPLVVTPHLKEGAGGLRDYQAANWLRLALRQPIGGPTAAFDEVLKLRNCLHIYRGKQSDELTHAAQSEIAATYGWDPRTMMRELHTAMELLHRYWQATAADVCSESFDLADNVRAENGQIKILAEATPSEAAIGVANGLKLGLKKSGTTHLDSRPLNAGQALRALMQGEEVIRELEASGVLQSLLPELTNTKTLLPDDHSHRFTVYEHTLEAVRLLRALPPFYAEAYHRIQDKGALWLAVLMHDVGKSDQSDSHSLTGERMVHVMASRWLLDQDRADLIAWLVRHHLLMSQTIRLRDVAQPDTIREFVSKLPSIEHLLMLTVLTWADSNAVGPGVWTQAQDGFLQDLLERSENAMRSQSPPFADVEVARSLLRRSLKHGDHSESAVEEFLQSMPAHYVLSTSPHDVRVHLDLATLAKQGQIVVTFSHNERLGATDVTLVAQDQPGLLSRALGLIYSLDVSVIGLRASTTHGSESVAVDVFTLSFGDQPVPPSTCSSLKRFLMNHLTDDDAVLGILRDRGKTIDVSPGEANVTYHPGHPGLLEMRGRRGRGMAYRLSRMIASAGWNVLGARVGQWAGQSTASFTLTSKDGDELTEKDVQEVFGA